MLILQVKERAKRRERLKREAAKEKASKPKNKGSTDNLSDIVAQAYDEDKVVNCTLS